MTAIEKDFNTGLPKEEKSLVLNPTMKIKDETAIHGDDEVENKIKVKEEIQDTDLENKLLPSSDTMKIKNNNDAYGIICKTEIKEETWRERDTSVGDQMHNEIKNEAVGDFPAAESTRLHTETAFVACSTTPCLWTTADSEEKDSVKHGKKNLVFVGTDKQVYGSDILKTSCIEQTVHLHMTKKPSKLKQRGKVNKCVNNAKESFSVQNTSRTHILCHEGKNSYQYDACEKRSPLKNHICQGRGLYKCQVCQKSFTQKSALNKHVLIHQVRAYKCDTCQKSFTRKSDLNRHILTHQGDRPYSCDVCKRSFSEKGNLNQHILIHQGKRPYKCEVCEKSFTMKGNLNKHILIHQGKRPYSCGICEKSFTQKNNLNSHILIHQGKRSYKCSVCEKSFITMSHLNAHILIHQCKRPYKCEICEKSFTHTSTLKNHLLIHQDKRPYKCEICERTFTRKGDLNTHILTHQGKRPYSCDVCEKNFTRKGSLNRHTMIHLGRRP